MRLIINCKKKKIIFSSSVLLLCVHTQYNPFAHPSHPSCSYYYLLSPIYCFCTSYLFRTFLYSIAHFTLYFSFFTYIYALVWCYFYIIFIILHCPLSGLDLIYISLLIIPCIIYYVTNKETLILTSKGTKIYIFLSYSMDLNCFPSLVTSVILPPL